MWAIQQANFTDSYYTDKLATKRSLKWGSSCYLVNKQKLEKQQSNLSFSLIKDITFPYKPCLAYNTAATSLLKYLSP